MSATPDDVMALLHGTVQGRTQDNFGRFDWMDQFAYDQETQGRDSFGSTSDLGEFGGFGSSQDILDYFSTPGLTPLQGVQTMMQYGIQPEDIASILGITPEDARAQYNAALAPFAQATAPPATVTAPPVRTLDDDIRDFFATGPTAQEVFDAMQANNVSPEAVINAMGFDPVEAMAEYNMFLNPANAPVSGADTGATTGATTATGATTESSGTEDVLDVLGGGTTTTGGVGGGIFDLLPSPVQGAVTKVGEAVDKVLIGAGDILGGFDPSLVVLNPVDPSATVVFGTPSGNTTPTIVGNMPTSGAPIGVVTGNPILDYVIGEVFSRSPPGQSNPSIVDVIIDVVLEEVGEATGVNAGAVASAAQGDVGGLIDAATKVVLGVNKSVAETDEKYQTQEEINRAATGTDQVTDLLEREPTNVDVTDPSLLEPGETTTSSETDDLINLIGGPGPDMGPIRTTTTTPATGTDTDDLINLIGGPGPDMGPIKTTATDTTEKVGDDTTVVEEDDTTEKVGDDTTVVEEDDTTKKVVDDTTVVEEDDTTKKVVDDTTVTDDTTKKVVDDTTVTDDTTKKVVDDTTVTDDTTKKVVDDTTVTDDTTKKVVDDTTVVEEDDTTKKVVDDTTVVEEDDTTKKVVDDTTVVEEDDTTKKVVDDTTVTDDTTKKVVDDTTVVEEDDTTKKVVDDTTVTDDTTKKVVSPDGPVTPPKVTTVTPPGAPGVIPTPIRQPQYAQSVYSVGTEKAGVADIGTPYDLNASLLENIMRILAEGDAGTEETELYGGGRVNGYNATDELIKLLRG